MDLELRAKELRKKILDFSLETGICHLGGSFSEIEILVSLYDCILKPEDKFILSKGHACAPLYLLLREKGYTPKIAGHPEIDIKNGINCTTGSLGHGLPIGVGMAFAKKKQNKTGEIYVLMSDGECQEGTTWESMDVANYYGLDNLTIIVDHNKLQALDKIKDVSPMNLKEKFKVFGGYTLEVNGHNFDELFSAFKYSKPELSPKVIIASTIKGKGVSYMENNTDWHGKRVTIERVKKAYEELK